MALPSVSHGIKVCWASAMDTFRMCRQGVQCCPLRATPFVQGECHDCWGKSADPHLGAEDFRDITVARATA